MAEQTRPAPAAMPLPLMLRSAMDAHDRLAALLARLLAVLATGLDALQDGPAPGAAPGAVSGPVSRQDSGPAPGPAPAPLLVATAHDLAHRAAAVLHELGGALQGCTALQGQAQGVAGAGPVQASATAAEVAPDTRQALAVLLGELAGHADSASCVLGAAINASDLRLVDAADTLVRNLGALADRMAESLGEAPVREPDEWRLSPRAVDAVALLGDESAPLGLAVEVA